MEKKRHDHDSCAPSSAHMWPSEAYSPFRERGVRGNEVIMKLYVIRKATFKFCQSSYLDRRTMIGIGIGRRCSRRKGSTSCDISKQFQVIVSTSSSCAKASLWTVSRQDSTLRRLLTRSSSRTSPYRGKSIRAAYFKR